MTTARALPMLGGAQGAEWLLILGVYVGILALVAGTAWLLGQLFVLYVSARPARSARPSSAPRSGARTAGRGA